MKRGYIAKHYFYVSDGGIIKTVKELGEELSLMPDDVYAHHVNSEKNDFSSWLENEFGLKDLAAKIKALKQKDAAKVIKSFQEPEVKIIEKIVEKPVMQKPKIITRVIKAKPIIKRIFVRQKPRVITKIIRAKPIIKRVFVKQRPQIITKIIRPKPIIKYVKQKPRVITKVVMKKPDIDEATLKRLSYEKDRLTAEIQDKIKEKDAAIEKTGLYVSGMRKQQKEAKTLEYALAKIRDEYSNISKLTKEKIAEYEQSLKKQTAVNGQIRKANDGLIQKQRKAQEFQRLDNEVKRKKQEAEEARKLAYDNLNAQKLAEKNTAAKESELARIKNNLLYSEKQLKERSGSLADARKEIEKLDIELQKKKDEFVLRQRKIDGIIPKEKAINKLRQEAALAGEQAISNHRVLKLAQKEVGYAKHQLQRIEDEHENLVRAAKAEDAKYKLANKNLSNAENKIKAKAGELREAEIKAERLMSYEKHLDSKIKEKEALAKKGEEKARFYAAHLKQAERQTSEIETGLDKQLKQHKQVSHELKEITGQLNKQKKEIEALREEEKKVTARVKEKKSEFLYLINKIDHLNKSAKASLDKYNLINSQKGGIEKEYRRLLYLFAKVKKDSLALETLAKEKQKEAMDAEKRKLQSEKEYANTKKLLPLLRKEMEERKEELSVIDNNKESAKKDLERLRLEEKAQREALVNYQKQLDSLKGIIRENERIIQERQKHFVEKETEFFSRENKQTEMELKIRQLERELEAKQRSLTDREREIQVKLNLLEKKEKEAKVAFSIGQK